MNINVIVPVWEGTGARVLYCVASLLRWISARNICVLNDISHSGSPLNNTILEQLPGSVRVVNTEYDRRGNLNGRAAISGLIENMHDESNDHCADFVCKIDPDVLTLNPKFLVDLALKGCPFVGTKRTSRLFGGSFYMLRSDILDMMHYTSSRLYDKPYSMPEDQVINSLAYMYASEQGPVILPEATSLDSFAHFVSINCSQWNDKQYMGNIRKNGGIVNYGTSNLIGVPEEDEFIFASTILKPMEASEQ